MSFVITITVLYQRGYMLYWAYDISISGCLLFSLSNVRVNGWIVINIVVRSRHWRPDYDHTADVPP